MGRINRIINIRFQLDGLHFDAAIDPDWDLHHYESFMADTDSPIDKESATPIEVYCFDHPEWDIFMIYQTKEDIYGSPSPINEQQDWIVTRLYDRTLYTVCDFDKIIEETKKWIEDNKD